MPTLAQLKEAVSIAEEIENLKSQLSSLIGGAEVRVAAPKAATTAVATPVAKGGKRQMSPEARERIAAAQRARWAKSKGISAPAAKVPAAAPAKKKRGLTPEGRAKIVAALKARWAKKKA